MKISDTIIRQLEMQLSMKEVEECLSDGKPHELTFINAIFVDGKSLRSPGNEPLVVEKTVTGSAEFNESLSQLMNQLTEAYRTVLRNDMLAVFGTAQAGIRAAYEILQGENMNEAEMGEAFRILGVGMALATKDLLDKIGLTDLEMAKDFRDYMANHPLPLDAITAYMETKAAEETAEESQ